MVAMTLYFAVGCDDHRLPALAATEISVEDLDGNWHVLTYGSDETGCTPQRAESPFERVVIEVDDKSSETPDLDIFLCRSDGNCPREAPPENALVWNRDHHRAEIIHHTANIHRIGPLEHRCRLAAIQTLLVPDGARLDVTRSTFEIALPMDDDEACNADLTSEYRAQMPCARSETVRLGRRDDS